MPLFEEVFPDELFLRTVRLPELPEFLPDNPLTTPVDFTGPPETRSPLR